MQCSSYPFGLGIGQRFWGLAAVVISLVAASAPVSATAEQPLLGPEDRIALVGGTLVERMQYDGSLEAELQTRRPDWRLRVRNVGWSGDDVHAFARKVFDPNPENGFNRLQHDLDLAAPTVVLLAYGFAEASNGAKGLQRFEPGLVRLVESMHQRSRRVILMRPFALPGVRTPDYENYIAQAGAVIDRVAKRFDLPVISVSCDQFASDGLLPSPIGFCQISNQLADALVGKGSTSPSTTADSLDGELVGKILRKDELFFHRHRPQNETYLLLFRKHEQGNNAVELAQFDPLVDAIDREIWQRAKELASDPGVKSRD